MDNEIRERLMNYLARQLYEGRYYHELDKDEKSRIDEMANNIDRIVRD